ncbi:MAG: hypothetical protein RIB65_00650 [Ilumatobacter fluminis]|uniref:hypothetical protein n=1 Tax=Ilumatobacter fluminis TaxID=467091 RepID=UPI0032EAD323
MSKSAEPTTSSSVWHWSPPPSAELDRKVRKASIVAAVVVLGAVGYAALRPGRASIVVAVMVISIVGFGWQEHRRFRRTTVELSADGVLRIDDGRQSGQIGVSNADTINVRRRTESGQSWTSATPRWTIEVAGPDGVLSHRIAHAAGLFNVDEATLRDLELELQTAVGVSVARSAADDASSTPSKVSSTTPVDSTTSAGARFEWAPPRSPNADRRRVVFRTVYIGLALAVAAYGAASEWGDTVGVILTASTVPGIVLVIGASFDYFLGRVRRFRLVVDDGVLHVFRGSGERTIPLAGADVTVDTRSHIHGSADGTTRMVNWFLSVRAADGTELTQQFPSFGTTTTHDDYVALERELRRRT